ncbi:PIN domain-containing protein [Benzoatithermus flavus]|uniref:PIN domain-containing protein n=1 Tax=Benzoatithermus flavus TaxID=3108223 RepID=UPI003AB02D8B
MIGLDTSLLVRLITDDEPAQADAVERLIESRCSADEPGFINRTALCELAWVLARRFRYSRAEIAEVVLGFYQASALLIEDTDPIPDALRLYTNSRADLADRRPPGRLLGHLRLRSARSSGRRVPGAPDGRVATAPLTPARAGSRSGRARAPHGRAGSGACGPGRDDGSGG